MDGLPKTEIGNAPAGIPDGCLALYPAGGVAPRQGKDLAFRGVVEILLNGMLQAAGRHRKLDGRLGLKAAQ